MKLTIEAEPKEIAALVLEIQERQTFYISGEELVESTFNQKYQQAPSPSEALRQDLWKKRYSSR